MYTNKLLVEQGLLVVSGRKNVSSVRKFRQDLTQATFQLYIAQKQKQIAEKNIIDVGKRKNPLISLEK
jgi:hypothetical protein